MLTTYFVAIRPQSNEHHTVHKEGCPFMPDDSKRIYLGDFSSSGDALNAGKRHFTKSDSCRFCSQDHHSEDCNRIFMESALPLSLMTLNKFAAGLDNTMLCCLN